MSPQRAGLPCQVAGCAGVVRPGDAACSLGHAVRARGDGGRASAWRRGYDARWKRVRVMWLRRHPLCVDLFGLHGNSPVAATDVDHVVPLADGGSDDTTNLQSLCHSCHSRKTADDVARRRGGASRSLTTSQTETGGQLFFRAREIEGGGF